MATSKDINNLVINKVENQQVYDYMVENNLINDDELYLVEASEEDVEIEIDASLSSTSENPVQNKVITSEFSKYETKNDADAKLAEAKLYTDTKTSDMATNSGVDNKISSHNVSSAAHNDIRDLISGLTTRLNTLVDSDDTTLDQLSEIVAYIKSNRSVIDSITTDKVNVSDVINNLTTNATNKPLSAAQGVEIKTLIDALQDEVDKHTHSIADVGGLQNALNNKAEQSALNEVSGIANEAKTASASNTSLINDNTSKINTLETEVLKKADEEHTHEISEIEDLTVTATELNHLDGVTSNVQAQLDGLSNDYMTKENPSGTGSFSMNRKAESTIGEYSHAEGYETTASGRYSHSEGSYTTASGYHSHSEGNGTTATEYASHAEGFNSNATGEYSHAEGYSTDANGDGSHSEGWATTASGTASHAEGSLTDATGADSHAEGSYTTASGECSHVEGFHTEASGEYQHVQGKYNIRDRNNTYAHIVGNGYVVNASVITSNAHTLDWDGNAWFAGDVTATDAEGRSVSLLNSSKKIDDLLDEVDNINDTTSSTTTTYSSNKIEDLLDEKMDANIVLEVNRGGTGYNTIADKTYSTARYRASSLHSSETTPTTNGVIAWTYE